MKKLFFIIIALINAYTMIGMEQPIKLPYGSTNTDMALIQQPHIDETFGEVTPEAAGALYALQQVPQGPRLTILDYYLSDNTNDYEARLNVALEFLDNPALTDIDKSKILKLILPAPVSTDIIEFAALRGYKLNAEMIKTIMKDRRVALLKKFDIDDALTNPHLVNYILDKIKMNHFISCNEIDNAHIQELLIETKCIPEISHDDAFKLCFNLIGTLNSNTFISAQDVQLWITRCARNYSISSHSDQIIHYPIRHPRVLACVASIACAGAIDYSFIPITALILIVLAIKGDTNNPGF